MKKEKYLTRYVMFILISICLFCGATTVLGATKNVKVSAHLEEVLSKATGKTTIILQKDINFPYSCQLNRGADIILDCNGHTIKTTSNPSIYVMKGSLNIRNGRIVVSGDGDMPGAKKFSIEVSKGATLTIKGGYFKNVAIGNSGKATISGGTYVNKSWSAGFMNGGTMTLSSVKLNCSKYAINGITNFKGGKLTIKSGTYKMSEKIKGSSEVVLKNMGKIDILQGTFVGEIWNNGGILNIKKASWKVTKGNCINVQGGNVNIDSGTYTTTGAYNSVIWLRSGTVTLNGGTYNVKKTSRYALTIYKGKLIAKKGVKFLFLNEKKEIPKIWVKKGGKFVNQTGKRYKVNYWS